MKNLTTEQLRRLLINAMIQSKGNDHVFGWLAAAYYEGRCPEVDEDKDYLIKQIEIYRAMKG